MTDKEPASPMELAGMTGEPGGTSTAQPETATPQETSGVLYGLDLSHFQGNFLENAESMGDIRFVICKATQGVNYVDPDFRNNWRELQQKGLIRGAYHFYVCSDDPLQQADHFATTVFDLGENDIAPVLDIEQGSMSATVSPDQMVQDILRFLREVEQKTNRKPILYTDYAFAQEYLKDAALADYALWLAEYSGAPEPMVPDLWKDKGFKIWQKSASYDMDSEDVDYDVHFGNTDELVD